MKQLCDGEPFHLAPRVDGYPRKSIENIPVIDFTINEEEFVCYNNFVVEFSLISTDCISEISVICMGSFK